MNTKGSASALRRVVRTRRLLDELGLSDPLEALVLLRQMLTERRADFPESIDDKGPDAMAKARASISKATGEPQ